MLYRSQETAKILRRSAVVARALRSALAIAGQKRQTEGVYEYVRRISLSLARDCKNSWEFAESSGII